MDIRWSTDTVPEPDRVPAWSDMLTRQVFPVRTEVFRPDDFRGDFRLRAFGPTAFLRVRSRRQRIVRGEAEISAGDESWLFVSTMIRGTGFLHHAGGVATVPRGGVSFVDGGQPFALEFRRDFDYVSALVLRRDILALLPESEAAHGKVIGAPAGPAIAAFLSALESSVDNGDRGGDGIGDENRLYDNFLGLAAAALMPGPGSTAPGTPPPDSDKVLLATIKSYLITHLAEDIAAPSVASRFGIADRKLQRLFKGEGTTLTLWLRRQRLERCAQDLSDPRQDGRSVTAIAGSRGFDDPTYFSRCFRAAFGVTPGAYRQDRDSGARAGGAGTGVTARIDGH
ncbi:AraC family transcriptional regulator [Inquilinus sp. CAU 1745]|uniref:AraC family transcriptional regulator n=1 Tax=Inquilinus sp. CAU 1745 TaxID=3140369 RepID=UPI00325BFFDF